MLTQSPLQRVLSLRILVLMRLSQQYATLCLLFNLSYYKENYVDCYLIGHRVFPLNQIHLIHVYLLYHLYQKNMISFIKLNLDFSKLIDCLSYLQFDFLIDELFLQFLIVLLKIHGFQKNSLFLNSFDFLFNLIQTVVAQFFTLFLSIIYHYFVH